MNKKQIDQLEEGLEIPFERINPHTLQKMIEEFVTREWSDPVDTGYALDDKVRQVIRQLKEHTAKVVYDVSTETWNIVSSKN